MNIGVSQHIAYRKNKGYMFRPKMTSYHRTNYKNPKGDVFYLKYICKIYPIPYFSN